MTSPPRARSRLRRRVALAIAPLVLVAALLAPEAAAGRAAPACRRRSPGRTVVPDCNARACRCRWTGGARAGAGSSWP